MRVRTRRRPAGPWLSLGLFLATCGTTFGTFLVQGGSTGLHDRAWDAAWYAGSVMLILGAHELGHFVMARHHGVETSWPYFIPVPFGFGTMGAVIRLRGRIPNRNALVDIGAAGPLTGLLVCVPLWVAGLLLSAVGPSPDLSDHFPGDFSLWRLAMSGGEAVGEGPVLQVFGDNVLSWGLQQLVVGPLEPGTDLFAHPVLVAAWLGFLVTMLNLLPIGQLDGGHLTYAWFGRGAVPLGKAIAGLLFLAAVLFSASWLAWCLVVTLLVKFRHPPVVDETAPLSRGRRVVCAVCLVLTLLTFMPTPLRFVTAP